MVGLTVLVVVLCVILGCCIGVIVTTISDVRYWKEVCTQLIAVYGAPQKKEEKTVVAEDGEPQW